MSSKKNLPNETSFIRTRSAVKSARKLQNENSFIGSGEHSAINQNSRSNFDNETSFNEENQNLDLNAEDIEELDAAAEAVDNLDIETQKALLRAFEMFYEQESEVMLNALEHSREEIKDSMVDLVWEQEKYKEELQKASEGRYSFERKKENSIPLSVYLRRKRGASAFGNLGASPVLDQYGNNVDIDKLAVEKYMKRRERQKVAEQNRLNREKSNFDLEAETQRILNKLKDVDMTKVKERERQLEKIQAKLKGRQFQQKNDKEVANEIMENYSETNAVFERNKQMQQERFKAHLSATKHKRALSPQAAFEKVNYGTDLKPRQMPKSLSTNNVSVVDV